MARLFSPSWLPASVIALRRYDAGLLRHDVVAGIIADHGISGLFICTIMAGVILILMGVTGTGTAVKFIPRPVIIGFTNGIAVLIASTQIRDFLGLEAGENTGEFLSRMRDITAHLGTLALPAVVLGAAAIARTATNVKSGGRTPVAGMVHAVTLAGVLLAGAGLAGHIPMPVLAAILFVVAWRMGEWHEILALLYIRRVSVTTTVSQVTHEAVVESQQHSLQQKEIPPYVAIFRIHGPFLFGATDKLAQVLEQLDTLPPIPLTDPDESRRAFPVAYWSRRTVSGSRRAARRAGTSAAASPMQASHAATPP